MAASETESLINSLWKLVAAILLTMSRLQQINQPDPIGQLVAHDPDTGRSTPQIITARGFHCQTHNITTSDGYYLTVYRIINPRFKRTRGPPLIVLHGFDASAESWFWAEGEGKGDINTPLDVVGNCAPFEFAKRGYDVWIPADRGTLQSPYHIKYNYDRDLEYWDYSLDELALIDLPAIIDHIRNKTGKPKVGFYGHSQGATRALMLLTKVPKYNKILQPTIILTAITYLRTSPNPAINPIVTMIPAADRILIQRRGKLSPSNMGILNSTCYRPIVGHVSLCGIFSLSSYMPDCHLNVTRRLVFGPNMPSAVSNWQTAQFIQIAKTNVFKMLDAGPQMNMERYGRVDAPVYDLSRITNPYVISFSSMMDLLQSSIDQARAMREIQSRGNRLFYEKVITTPFCHFDFQYGMTVGKEVIAPTLDLLSYFK